VSRNTDGVGIHYSVALCLSLAGVIIGLMTLVLRAGYWEGGTDAVIMRAADVTLSFPPILLADDKLRQAGGLATGACDGDW